METISPLTLAIFGAALSIGLSAIGAGVGISIAGAGTAGAGTKRPEVLAKSLISIVLAEALAIYGLLISFMIIMRLDVVVAVNAGFEGGFICLAAGLAMGLSALGAGFAIGYCGSAMSSAIAERPEVFSKTVIGVVLGEALAIYGLLIAFMILMQL